MWLWDLQTKHPAIYLFLKFSPSCLRPKKYGKTEKAPHWKSTSWWFETCVILSVNSFAVSHGLLENAQQSLSGAGGLHSGERALSPHFSACWHSVQRQVSGRLCFVRWGGCLRGDMVDNWCVGPMHGIMEKPLPSGKGQCSLVLLIYLHRSSWRFQWKKKASGAQSTMPPKVFWCQKRLTTKACQILDFYVQIS